MTSWSLTVEGHDWVVTDRADEPGAYDFSWLTGPAGYGFTMGSSTGAPTDEAGMRRAITDFLAHVDPVTGYLE